MDPLAELQKWLIAEIDEANAAADASCDSYEAFYAAQDARRVVLDEIERLLAQSPTDKR